MTDKKILAVVDDDPIFQIIVQKLFKACAPDYQVITFNNGEDMMRFLLTHCGDEERIPNLMLLDINMPLMDGWMFLEEFKNLQGSIKKLIQIYLTSSSIDPKDIARAKLENDVVDYLIKPLTPEVAKKITT